MLFKNLYSTLLNEAPGDEEEEETNQDNTEDESTEESPDTDETPEENEEEEDSELSDEDQEFNDSPGADNELDAESDEQSDNEDSSTDGEEAEVVGNPHAKRVYYDRFENLESLIEKFLETIKQQEVHYKNDDKTERRNREIVKYVKAGLGDTLKQLNYILVKGAITSLNIEATQKIYAKMKTKIDTYLKLYAKIMDVDL